MLPINQKGALGDGNSCNVLKSQDIQREKNGKQPGGFKKGPKSSRQLGRGVRKLSSREKASAGGRHMETA